MMRVSRMGSGYFSVRIAGKIKALHRYVWELYNGPIPLGMIIHHVNGNKACNCIANLQMMSKAEHSRQHSNDMSEEIRQKISAAGKGNQYAKGGFRSAEHRLRISEAHRGKVVSPETRKKMSEAQKGRPGSPRSAETRRKIGEASKGREHTEEARKRMSEARKEYYRIKREKRPLDTN